MITIKNKNSVELITSFPAYGKHQGSNYGYLIVTVDKKVIFVYPYKDQYESCEITYDDVTKQYELL